MKTFWIALACLALAATSGCNEQQAAYSQGGTYTKDLPRGEKLVTVTWKEQGDLWILTRKMREEESPEEYTFRQDKSGASLWGEGKVILREHR